MKISWTNLVTTYLFAFMLQFGIMALTEASFWIAWTISTICCILFMSPILVPKEKSGEK